MVSNTIELLGIVLGSNLIIEVAKHFLSRKKSKADVHLLETEAHEIALAAELKLTDFYRKQVEILIDNNRAIEEKLNQKIIAHAECEARIDGLEAKYRELQRQFTLLKTQINKS